MTELTVDLFISLDGFAKGVEYGPFFGYGGPDLDAWISDVVSRPHLTLMGRVTYELMAGMVADATDEGSRRMTELPKVVFSNSLEPPLVWQNTELLSGDLATAVRALKERTEVPIRTIGSVTLARSLFALGLVDRLRLTVFPVVVGDAGREPMFADYRQAPLDLVGTTVLDARVVVLEYACAQDAGSSRPA